MDKLFGKISIYKMSRVKKGNEFYKKDRKNIFIIIQKKVLFEEHKQRSGL